MVRDSVDANERDSLGIKDKSVSSISLDLFERKRFLSIEDSNELPFPKW